MSNENNQTYDAFEFVRGQKACRDGIAHNNDESKSFTSGYNAQYELEQINENRTRGQQ